MSKLVVYTAIFGNKDALLPAPQFDDVAYVCFTDSQPVDSYGWQIVHIKPHFHDPRRNARMYKTLPHKFFPDHEWSLWLDGNRRLLVNPLDLIERYLSDGQHLLVHRHQLRDCVYEEASSCIELGKTNPEIMREQILRYQQAGLPRHAGVVDSSVLLRRHHDPLLIETMNDWWAEICRYSVRDQVSFTYVAYRHELDYTTFPMLLQQSPYFGHVTHLYIRDKTAYRIVLRGLDQIKRLSPTGYEFALRQLRWLRAKLIT